MILYIGAILNLCFMLFNYLSGSTNGIIVNGFCVVALLLLSKDLD
ncbi:TPA: hypothetical protein ACXI9J_001330 [Clostridioides difficile]